MMLRVVCVLDINVHALRRVPLFAWTAARIRGSLEPGPTWLLVALGRQERPLNFESR